MLTEGRRKKNDSWFRKKIPIKGIESIAMQYNCFLLLLGFRKKIPIKGIERYLEKFHPVPENFKIQKENPNKGNWKYEGYVHVLEVDI